MNFITIVSERGGVNKFIIHARKAFLKGLDPKQNRNIPPLKYDWVIRLKEEFPHLEFVINGGFLKMEEIHDILKPENGLSGCMVGRLAMHHTWDVARLDREFYSQDHEVPDSRNREEIILEYSDYAQAIMDEEIAKHGSCSNTIMCRPIINMFVGEYKGAQFKRSLMNKSREADYKGKVKLVINDSLAWYKTQNPEALVTINGEKVIKPSWILAAHEADKLQYHEAKAQKLQEQLEKQA